MNGNIRRLSHIITAIEPTQQIARLRYDKDSWADAVYRYYLPLGTDRETRNNIDVADCNFLEEVAVLGEDLHAGTLVAPVADYIFARRSHNGHLARVPQLALIFSWYAELELEGSSLLKDLQSLLISCRKNTLCLSNVITVSGR